MIDDLFDENERQVFRVTEVDYAHLCGDLIVDSGGMGGCVAVFVYNKPNQEVFAGHFYVSRLEKTLPNMLEECRQKFKRAKNIKVYVAGAGYSEESTKEDSDLTEKTRAYVLHTLAKYGFNKNLKISWTESDDGSSMRLDLLTGKVEVKKFRVREYRPEDDDPRFEGDEPA